MYVTTYNFDCVINYNNGIQYYQSTINQMTDVDLLLRRCLQEYTYDWVINNVIESVEQ